MSSQGQIGKLIADYLLNPIQDWIFEFAFYSIESVVGYNYLPNEYRPENGGRAKISSILFLILLGVVAAGVSVKLFQIYTTITDA